MIHYTDYSFNCIVKKIRIKPILVAALVIATIFLSLQVCKAESDLDDDISKYKDDAIAKWDELGKDSVNINFIVAEALGRIKLTGKNVNINSVVIGPGSNVGNIYNIHLNEPGGPIKPNNQSKR
jgi:hypothetical protein